MKIKIITPTKALLEDYSEEELKAVKKDLTYTNTSVQFLIKKHYNNRFWKNKNEDGWKARLEELKGLLKSTLVFEDDNGIFIRPGSISYLAEKNISVENTIIYPSLRPIPWSKKLPFDFYPYQSESFEKLLSIKHGSVELCTGAGKSAIILRLCREMGLKTAIIAPSVSIFSELLNSCETYLGKKYVGTYGNGKKKIDKLITVCIGDSLCNVKKDSKEWEFFSTLDVILIDESHLFSAETLEDVCHGLLGNVPYRFFLSGTQTRGDGTEKLLQSIIGETVHTLSTKEAVTGGYICPHDFRIVSIESSNPNLMDSDPLEMKRIHFLRNKNIAAFIAKIAKIEATTSRRQSLVLVEELSQIAMLSKLLKAYGIPTAIAHSESRNDRLKELGLEKVDTAESVEKFNKAEAMVLLGTSCIATGTNIYPTHNTFNWIGGSSTIKTKQGAVGRSVRLHNQNPWKDLCVKKEKSTIWDFNVFDIGLMGKQIEDRIEDYMDSGSEIKYIKLKT